MPTNINAAKKAAEKTNPRFVKSDDRGKFQKPYTRKQVAGLLGKSVYLVDYYARKGTLVRVMSASCPWRSIGYTAESVRKLVEGRAE